MDRLRIPKRKARPKFAEDVPLDIRAHVWIVWLRKVAADRAAQPDPHKQVCFISAQGTEDLAQVLEQLAQRP